MTATTLAASASSAYERMRARAPRGAVPAARVRTRKVGFRLGGFGFTYTAKDMDLGHAPPAPPAAATLPPASPRPDRTARPQHAPDTSARTRKRGHLAYAAQLCRLQEEAVPRSVLLSVV